MRRFIFAHDGTAVNIDHIVVIFLSESSHPAGFVVRCRTVLGDHGYTNQHALLNLSPVLADKEAAQAWLNASVKDFINPDFPF